MRGRSPGPKRSSFPRCTSNRPTTPPSSPRGAHPKEGVTAAEYARVLAHDVVSDTDDPTAGRVRLEQYLTRLSVDPDLPAATLSGGQRRRVHLAAALAAPWNILLLDEPTNHLDIATTEWLEETLISATRSKERALLFVSHDRAFAKRVSTRVIGLDRGRLHSFPGSYTAFVARREEYALAEEAREREEDKKRAREEAWLARGVKARRTRNEGRVRALLALREEAASRRERTQTANITIAEAHRSGAIVFETTGASFAYDATPIVRELTTVVYKGDRVAIIGPNGCGKTTLLRVLLGDLTPQTGATRIGAAVEIAYYDQQRAALDDRETVWEALGRGYDTIEVNGRRRHVMAYMEEFAFREEDRNRPVATLSGGERSRLLLARLFARRSNVLVLDEPTNDLDEETLELLEAQLVSYRGTILLVSHDRAFIDNVATRSLVFEGAAVVAEHAGGYSDYVTRRRSGGESASGGERKGKRERRTTAPRERTITYRERLELQELPARIEGLERDHEAVSLALSDPALYRDDDGTETVKLTARLHELERGIEEGYARWEALSALEERSS